MTPTPTTMPVAIHWPVALDQAIQAEITGRLPVEVEELVKRARAQAYRSGVLDGMKHYALNEAEARLYGAAADRRARDAAEFRRITCREQLEHDAAQSRARANIAAGRHPLYQYRGGPVDWETGLPKGSACAWLRRTVGTENPDTMSRRDSRVSHISPVSWSHVYPLNDAPVKRAASAKSVDVK